MRRSLTFRDTKFSAEFIEQIINIFLALSGIKDIKQARSRYSLWIENETCSYDSLEEFLHDYEMDFYFLDARISYNDYYLRLFFSKNYDYSLYEVEVGAPTNLEIYKILNPLNQKAKKFHIEFPEKLMHVEKREDNVNDDDPIIFIGHGRNPQWKELRDHLRDQQHYKVRTYESAPRTGHSITEVLKEMLNESNFAVLIFTGENKYKLGSVHPRENVIHELGLFQGRLDFNKAIILLEKGTRYFSNIDGIQQIRFSKNNIKTTFGDVVATIKREFGKMSSR